MGKGDDDMLVASRGRWRDRRRVFEARRGAGMLPPAFVRRHVPTCVWGLAPVAGVCPTTSSVAGNAGDPRGMLRIRGWMRGAQKKKKKNLPKWE